MNSYTFTHEVPVPSATVWGVLTDHPGMSRWTPLRRVVMERGGAPEPHGVGAVRALHLAGPPIREEVTAFDVDRLFGYRMLSGLPVRDYTAEVVLEPTRTGSRFRWTITFAPIVPGVQFPVAAAIRMTARSLAKEATRRGVGVAL